MIFRKELSPSAKLIVLKIGSQSLVNDRLKLRQSCIQNICSDILQLRAAKKKVIVVSSGAIALGKIHLKKSNLKQIYQLQAMASLGQPILMQYFNQYLQQNCAQILLTHEDIKNKTRNINLLNTINELLKNDIIPIVNENDSVSFEEITLGDNDQLSSMVAELCSADVLCMLSQSDGLFDKDPSLKDAQAIPYISYNDDLKYIKTISKSLLGRGGMKTKIQAVKKLSPLGIPVVIGSFNHNSPVLRILQQEKGSFFAAAKLTKKHRLLKLQTRAKANCHINIDFGAAQALQKNASLLPSGIKSIHGNFQRGDIIALKNNDKILAYGICEYSAKDISKIKGLKSNEIIKQLGYIHSKVVIHKNNLYVREKK